MSGSALGKYIDWSKSRRYWNSAAVPLSLRTRARTGPRAGAVCTLSGLWHGRMRIRTCPYLRAPRESYPYAHGLGALICSDAHARRTGGATARQ